MAIKSKSEMPRRKMEIDLTGPDGNVFVLIGIARNLANEIWGKRDPDLIEVAEILKDDEMPRSMADIIAQKMISSDYENAIQVFDEYFGNYVTLYR